MVENDGTLEDLERALIRRCSQKLRRMRPRRTAPAGAAGRAAVAGGWPVGRRGFAAVVVGAVLGGASACGKVDNAIQELTLPLRHEDIIRQQAGEKGVDAALIAAVIYAESKFRDQTSSAGARGLMQITPEAAHEIEKQSGGTTFKLEDLCDPEINIRYGTFLLRELLDLYDGDEVAALAAYNAGPGNVDRWGGGDLSVDDIGFPETRAYVEEVLEKQDEYRDEVRARSWATDERGPAGRASRRWRSPSASSSPTPRSSSSRCRTSTASSTPASPASPGCWSPSTS